MSSAKEDALSPDELRKRLYQTFKSKGVLDTLKVSQKVTLQHTANWRLLWLLMSPRHVGSSSLFLYSSVSLLF